MSPAYRWHHPERVHEIVPRSPLMNQLRLNMQDKRKVVREILLLNYMPYTAETTNRWGPQQNFSYTYCYSYYVLFIFVGSG